MRHLFLTFLFTGIGFLYAQDFPKVSLRMYCLEGTKEPEPLIMVTQGKPGEKPTETPCKPSIHEFSDPIVIELLSDSIGFLNAENRSPVAKVTVPKGATSIFLLFIKGGEGADQLPWRIFAFDDSIKAIPTSASFVANLTNVSFQYAIGERKIELKPGVANSTPKPTEIDNFNMAHVMFRYKSDIEWLLISETDMPFMPGLRYFMFTYLDAGGKPRLVTYRDILPEPAPPVAPTR